jgi:hypothetical protein
MPAWRIYLDESGDHTYRVIADPRTRYLALTAVLVRRANYEAVIQPQLEALKQRHFKYDPDNPPILHRADIVRFKGCFGVLREPDRRNRWEDELVTFFEGLRAQVFTVVIDKDVHRRRYSGAALFDPYAYSLAVLLNRVRGFLERWAGPADIVAESRGKLEDGQLLRAYEELRQRGDYYRTSDEYQKSYPEPGIAMRRKDQNVAGLQIADMLAASQKVAIVQKHGRPLADPASGFTQRLNGTVARMVNQYGQYLLD